MTAKLICRVSNDNHILCEFCGRLYVDKLEHFAWNCYKTREDKNLYWNFLINDFDVSISAHMFSLENDEFVDCLLGANMEIDIEEAVDERLMFLNMNFLSTLYPQMQ